MPQSVTTFLMFEGAAEAAIQLYQAAFEALEVTSIDRHGPEEGDNEGSVRDARFRLCGQEFRCYDSTIHHEFTFTPSISLFVECTSGEELERAFSVLAEGGQVLMPPDNYGFSQRFAWVQDRFGVSWQINLASAV